MSEFRVLLSLSVESLTLSLFYSYFEFGQAIECIVLVIIKLMKVAVAVRLRCGFSKLTFCLYFIIFSDV